jgi:hypothetical protein
MAISIDREWAESLVGWWPEFSGTTLCPGKISAVNFDDEAGCFFLLQLDGEEWTYPMYYMTQCFIILMRKIQTITSFIFLMEYSKIQKERK